MNCKKILALVFLGILQSCQDATPENQQIKYVQNSAALETVQTSDKGILTINMGPKLTCIWDEKNQSASEIYSCLQNELQQLPEKLMKFQSMYRTPELTSGAKYFSEETPRGYTIEELKKLSLNLNSNNRIGLENLKMAKLNMKLRYQNLLPHLSINSGVTFLTSGLTVGLLTAIGDLVPFLLPTRWIQAKQSEDLKNAQELAQQILTRDNMQLIEGMAWQVVNDARSLLYADEVVNLFNANYLYVQKKEQLGKIRKGRLKDLASVANQLKEMQSSLKKNYAMDLMELSSVIGFKNPLAIKNIIVEYPFSAGNAPAITFDDIVTSNLVDKSLELLQLNALIKSQASSNKWNSGFQWLDPSGDPQGGLGFGLGTYIKLGESEGNLLKEQALQMQNTIVKKMAESIGNYQASKEAYTQAWEGVKLQVERISAANEEFVKEANDTPLGELQDSFGQLANQLFNLASGEFGLYSEKSRMNRLLLVNSYE